MVSRWFLILLVTAILSSIQSAEFGRRIKSYGGTPSLAHNSCWQFIGALHTEPCPVMIVLQHSRVVSEAIAVGTKRLVEDFLRTEYAVAVGVGAD